VGEGVLKPPYPRNSIGGKGEARVGGGGGERRKEEGGEGGRGRSHCEGMKPVWLYA